MFAFGAEVLLLSTISDPAIRTAALVISSMLGRWSLVPVAYGLKPGERIIVQGAQKAREGSTVKVKDWTPPAPQVASDGSPAQKNP